MNSYYEHWKNTEQPRDYVFDKALYLLNKQPAKILEIGTSRRLEDNAHASDGYSTFNWCEYIQEFGGSLDICDVDPVCIENCKILISDFISVIGINFHLRDGLELIDDSYSLIYFDGSDCNLEMVKQFEKMNRYKTIGVCDDANLGGKCDLLRTKYTDYEVYRCWPATHEMLIYPRLNG